MNDETSRSTDKAPKVLTLTAEQQASLSELKALRSEQSRVTENLSALEARGFQLERRLIEPSTETIKEYFRTDSSYEIFAEKKSFAERWQTDCETLLADGFHIFISAAETPTLNFDCAAGRWNSEGGQPDAVSFGLAPDGMVSEIGRLTDVGLAFPINCFEVTGLSALKQYVELLRSNPASWEEEQKTSKCGLASVIEEIYLPFFRNPEEFALRFVGPRGQELASVPILTWVKLNSLRDLVRLHLDKQRNWLSALVNYGTEARGTKAGEWVATLEFPEEVSLEECTKALGGLGTDAFWSPDCAFEYLVVDLSGSAKAYSFPFLPPRSVFTGDWQRLRVLCRVSKRHSASFLASMLSSHDGKSIVEALRKSVESGSTNGLKSVFIDLPPLKQQVRTWAEAALECGALAELRKQAAPLDDNALTLAQKRQSTRTRLALLRRAIGGKGDEIQELDRVLNPLPFFFEFPILQWERTSEKMAFSNAVGLFQQLNKVSCLIGFEEILRESNKASLKALLGEELVKSIAGKPSLGHWSRALDILERESKNFIIWKRWFETLARERDARIRLVEIRNRIAHPDFVLEEEVLDGAANDFAAYFRRIVPQLRTAYAGIGCYISRRRKLIRSEDGKPISELDCERIDVPVEPFPRVTLSFAPQVAETLVDDGLFCTLAGTALELRHFFRLRQAKMTKREIYLYEREYSGHEAVWSGLTTAQSGKLDTPGNLFS